MPNEFTSCRGCINRSAECHATCPLYTAERAMRDEVLKSKYEDTCVTVYATDSRKGYSDKRRKAQRAGRHHWR